MTYQRPRDTGLPHPADGCPKCAGPFALVPFRAEPDGPRAVRCWYRCGRCLHSWVTSWSTAGMAGVPHYFPDCHDATRCACGCGLRLLRPAARRAEGAT